MMIAHNAVIEAFIRCMSENTVYCLWMLFSGSELVKCAYNHYNMQNTLSIPWTLFSDSEIDLNGFIIV